MLTPVSLRFQENVPGHAQPHIGRALKTSMGVPGELLGKLWGSGVPELFEEMISLHIS